MGGGLSILGTKIKYLSVANKVCKITSINWLHLYIEVKETDLSVGDVSRSKLWDITEFEDFKIRLINGDGVTKVIYFVEWVKRRKRM